MANFRALLLALLCFGQVAQAKAPLIFNGSNAKLLNSAAGQLVDANGVAYPRTGEKNYLTAASSTATGWAATSGVTVTTTTSSLPRTTTTGSGLLVTRSSGSTAFAYTDIIIDPADYNKKLKVQFDMAPNGSYAASDQEVDVYTCTIAWGTVTPGVCSGTTARLPLSTDASSLSLLPLSTGTYRTTFDAGGATVKWVQIQLGLHAATASSAVVYSDVIVGPGVVTQGAAMTEWTGYTPTVSPISGYGISPNGKWRRVGDSAEIVVNFNKNGSIGVGAGDLTFSLPTGMTLDTSKVVTNQTYNYGTYELYNGTNFAAAGIVARSDNTNVGFYKASASTKLIGTDILANSEFAARFIVPVAEWSGAGTINVVQNDVSYYSAVVQSAGTWVATGTLTAVQGAAGSLGGTSTPAAAQLTYTITPTIPIPSGTSPYIEVSADQAHWARPGATSYGTGANFLSHVTYDGSNVYGIGVGVNTSGQMIVEVGKYATTNTGNTWSTLSTWYWRVVVAAPGQAIGFSNATDTSTGLLPPVSTMGDSLATTLGYKTYRHGTSYNGGNAPTITLQSGGGTLTTVTLGDFIPYLEQDGVWRLRFNIYVVCSSTSRAALVLAVNGLAFHATSYQSINGAAVLASAGNFGYAITDGPNTNRINVTHNTSITATDYVFSGDVRLASKPTWAY